jgi:uncharacterized membrane protein
VPPADLAEDEKAPAAAPIAPDPGGPASTVPPHDPARPLLAPNQVAAAIVTLVAITASLVLALVQGALGRSFFALVSANQLPPGTRRLMMAVTLGVTGAVGAGLAAAWFTKGQKAALWLVKSARVLSPLVIATFVPSLFWRGPWKNLEFEYLVVLGIAGLILERLLAVSLSELRLLRLPSILAQIEEYPALARWLRRLPVLLVGAAVVYYAVLISHYTLITHVRMETATPDLGEYDNQFFNALHGHPFRLPASEGNLEDWSALKFHADFVIYFLLPFYALKPGPETLLIMQSVLVALTAVPIYLFAARRVPRWIAAVLAIAFLLLPVVERPNFYDFHAVPIGMFFMAWTVDAVDRILHSDRPTKWNYALLWSAFVLALASREDIAFGMIVVSAFLLFYGKRPALIASMLGASLAYFVLIKFVIMPRIGLSWYDTIYEDIKAAGFKGYGAVVVTLLTNPVYVLRTMVTQPKLLYLCHMTVPLLFLWVRKPYLLVAAVPSVFFTLMVTNRPPMFQSSFQYAFGWFPYIVTACTLALQGMRSLPGGVARQTAAALALAFTASGAGFQYGVLLGGDSIVGGFSEKKLVVSPGERRRYEQLQAITEQIPEDASVTATSNEGPHVSTRLELYNLGWALPETSDYILFQNSLGGEAAKRVIAALESGNYGVADKKGPFVLVKRGAKTDRNASLIATLRKN